MQADKDFQISLKGGSALLQRQHRGFLVSEVARRKRVTPSPDTPDMRGNNGKIAEA